MLHVYSFEIYRYTLPTWPILILTTAYYEVGFSILYIVFLIREIETQSN